MAAINAAGASSSEKLLQLLYPYIRFLIVEKLVWLSLHMVVLKSIYKVL